MHNGIICIIKIRENILQLVQLMKSYHQDGNVAKCVSNLIQSLTIHQRKTLLHIVAVRNIESALK